MTRPGRAFTLLELLISLAITSLLVVVLVSVVSATMNVWQQGRNQIDTFASARQVLGRMADEVKGAIASAGQVEFSEDISSIQGTTAPQSGTAENIFFVAPYPNIGSGDLCVFGYRLNSDTHELQRGFVDSQKAFSATPRYRNDGYSAINFKWQTIARGVVEFEVRCYSQVDMDNSTEPTNPWDSMGSDVNMIGNVPRRITLRLKVIDDKSLPRFVGLAPGTTPYNSFVSHYARNFTVDSDLVRPH